MQACFLCEGYRLDVRSAVHSANSHVHPACKPFVVIQSTPSNSTLGGPQDLVELSKRSNKDTVAKWKNWSLLLLLEVVCNVILLLAHEVRLNQHPAKISTWHAVLCNCDATSCQKSESDCWMSGCDTTGKKSRNEWLPRRKERLPLKIQTKTTSHKGKQWCCLLSSLCFQTLSNRCTHQGVPVRSVVVRLTKAACFPVRTKQVFLP